MLRFILYVMLFSLIYYFIKNIIVGYKNYSSSKKKKKNGNVTIDFSAGNKKDKRKNDVGEYVDYEEVDE
jgi:hypothetical protein